MIHDEIEEGGAKQGIDDGHAQKVQNKDQKNGDQLCKCQCHQ